MYSKKKSLSIGQAVFVHNFGSGPKWTQGRIVAKETSTQFRIKLSNGKLITRHLDHIREKETPMETSTTERVPLTPQLILPPIVHVPVDNQPSSPSDTHLSTGNTEQPEKELLQNHAKISTPTSTEGRYPRRI